MHKILFAVVLATSLSLAQAEELSSSRTGLTEAFHGLAQDPGFAKFIIEPMIENNRIREGLVVMGNQPHPFELKTAEKLASYWSQFGYTFVLMTQVNGVDVPAFDGILLDQNLDPIANISLKSSYHPGPDGLYKTMASAMEKVKTFTHVKGWVNHLIENSEWRHTQTESFTFAHQRQYDSFIQLKNTLQLLISVLGVETGRPTWIIADIDHSDQLTKKDIQKIGLIYDMNTRHKGLILTEKGVYRLGADRMVYERTKDCKKLLMAE